MELIPPQGPHPMQHILFKVSLLRTLGPAVFLPSHFASLYPPGPNRDADTTFRLKEVLGEVSFLLTGGGMRGSEQGGS